MCAYVAWGNSSPFPRCVLMLIYLAVPVRLLCSLYGMCFLVSGSMYSFARPKSMMWMVCCRLEPGRPTRKFSGFTSRYIRLLVWTNSIRVICRAKKAKLKNIAINCLRLKWKWMFSMLVLPVVWLSWVQSLERRSGHRGQKDLLSWGPAAPEPWHCIYHMVQSKTLGVHPLDTHKENSHNIETLYTDQTSAAKGHHTACHPEASWFTQPRIQYMTQPSPKSRPISSTFCVLSPKEVIMLTTIKFANLNLLYTFLKWWTFMQQMYSDNADFKQH